MSDAVTLALIGLALAGIQGLTAVLLAVIARQNVKAAIQRAAVAEKLDENTKATDKKLAEMSKTGEATHMLVNSAMGAQKRLLKVTSEALAAKDPTEANIKAAEEARKDLEDHEKKQAALDAKEAR